MTNLERWMSEYGELTGQTGAQVADLVERITEEAKSSVFPLSELLDEEMRAARQAARSGLPPGTVTR